MKNVYADNNATTRVSPEVIESLLPYLTTHWHNPSSMYELAQVPQSAIEESRKTIAKALKMGPPTQLLFTSCATESNNAAIFGTVHANPKRKHIITSSVEHPAVLEVCKNLERQGLEVTYLPVNESGEMDPVEFIKALRPDTLLVTVMHANNETGVIFPIAELARITKETDPSIVFHTDATQSVGKLPIDLSGEFKDVDLLSFSGHKLHAPKGVGGLFIRRGTPCRPFLIGGHQESNRRGGTENVPYIVGMAKAVELAMANIEEEDTRVRSLRDRLEAAIKNTIPWVEINGAGAPRLPNTLNVACHFIEGEGILYQLDSYGIAASSGSACTSGSLDPSHVLTAMKVPFTAKHGSVRFSFSRYNTVEDIDHVIEVFPKVVAALRRMSPYWDNQKNEPRKDVELLVEN